MPWFLGRALGELIKRSGVAKSEIDGLAVSSYLLAPDNGASLTDMFGLSPRFLIDFPYGGACGVIAVKRAARAVQDGDAEIVACIAGDIAPQGYGFNAAFSTFSRDHVYPNGGGGMNAVFSLITSHYMNAFGATREDFGRICIAQRANSARPSDGAVQAAADDGGLSQRAADLRSDRAVRLRAARLRRRGLSGDDRRSRAVARASLCADRRRGRAPQRLCRRPGDLALRRRRRKRRSLPAGRRRAGRHPVSSRPTTTIRSW